MRYPTPEKTLSPRSGAPEVMHNSSLRHLPILGDIPDDERDDKLQPRQLELCPGCEYIS